MKLNHHYKNDILIAELISKKGGMLQDDINELTEELLNLHKGKDKIALDMTDKAYLNSNGLGQLIKLKDNLLDKGINLIIINPADRVKSLLNMVGVDAFFNIIDNEDQL